MTNIFNNIYFKYLLMFLSVLVISYGSYLWGYGTYKHSQKLNLDDFIKTFARYQELRTKYGQYFPERRNQNGIVSTATEYDIKQYILQNLYFKHGLYAYRITGEVVKGVDKIQFKKLVILNYNPVVNVNERLMMINSLFDLYV